jgi:hypothetical protein
MIQSPDIPRPRAHLAGKIGAAIMLLGIAFAVGVLIADSWPEPRESARSMMVLEHPVVRYPTSLPASAAGLSGDTPVIGVTAGGQHRAYVIAALVPVHLHIVNDVLGDAPVTVAYCDRSDHVRVFTSPDSDGPLDVSVGGWVGRYDHGCMLLHVGDVRYRLDSGEAIDNGEGTFPYPDYNYVLTTWGEWRAAHPDTDVYVGEADVELPGS